MAFGATVAGIIAFVKKGLKQNNDKKAKSEEKKLPEKNKTNLSREYKESLRRRYGVPQNNTNLENKNNFKPDKPEEKQQKNNFDWRIDK